MRASTWVEALSAAGLVHVLELVLCERALRLRNIDQRVIDRSLPEQFHHLGLARGILDPRRRRGARGPSAATCLVLAPSVNAPWMVRAVTRV